MQMWQGRARPGRSAAASCLCSQSQVDVAWEGVLARSATTPDAYTDGLPHRWFTLAQLHNVRQSRIRFVVAPSGYSVPVFRIFDSRWRSSTTRAALRPLHTRCAAPFVAVFAPRRADAADGRTGQPDAEHCAAWRCRWAWRPRRAGGGASATGARRSEHINAAQMRRKQTRRERGMKAA